jgi:hypothetical protein
VLAVVWLFSKGSKSCTTTSDQRKNEHQQPKKMEKYQEGAIRSLEMRTREYSFHRKRSSKIAVQNLVARDGFEILADEHIFTITWLKTGCQH